MRYKSKPSKTKRHISTAFAMNLVIGFLSLLIVWYMLTAGILLSKRSLQLEQKLSQQEQSTICFANNCLDIELAKTPEERSKGLMFRKALPQDAGMLFVFNTPKRYAFWMKNTSIPLDMIRLDSDQKVVHIEHNVPPCWEEESALNTCPSYRTEIPASYVLEINAGRTETLHIQLWDKATLTNL